MSSLTLQHMYTLHSHVLAIASLLLSVIHLAALLSQEQKGRERPYLTSEATPPESVS